MTAARIVTRPAGAGDEAVLRVIFAGAREMELSMLPGDDAFRERFIDQQYAAQRAGYATVYPAAVREVIVIADDVVGVLETERTAARWRLIDIAVLPEARGRGVGGAVLQQLLADAGAAGRHVDLEVMPWNPAAALYARFGFVATGGDEMRTAMTWEPAAAVAPADDAV